MICRISGRPTKALPCPPHSQYPLANYWLRQFPWKLSSSKGYCSIFISVFPLVSSKPCGAELEVLSAKGASGTRVIPPFSNPFSIPLLPSTPHIPVSSLQASQLGVYKAFVDNYKVALETAEKCSQSNNQFQKISEVGSSSYSRPHLPWVLVTV